MTEKQFLNLVLAYKCARLLTFQAEFAESVVAI